MLPILATCEVRCEVRCASASPAPHVAWRKPSSRKPRSRKQTTKIHHYNPNSKVCKTSSTKRKLPFPIVAWKNKNNGFLLAGRLARGVFCWALFFLWFLSAKDAKIPGCNLHTRAGVVFAQRLWLCNPLFGRVSVFAPLSF